MLTEVADLDLRAEHLLRSAGHDKLAAVCDGHEPASAVHSRTEVITVALGSLTGVHAHAHPDGGWLRPHLRRKGNLGFHRGGYRVARTAERCGEPVPTGCKHVAIAALDR